MAPCSNISPRHGQSNPRPTRLDYNMILREKVFCIRLLVQFGLLLFFDVKPIIVFNLLLLSSFELILTAVTCCMDRSAEWVCPKNPQISPPAEPSSQWWIFRARMGGWVAVSWWDHLQCQGWRRILNLSAIRMRLDPPSTRLLMRSHPWFRTQQIQPLKTRLTLLGNITIHSFQPVPFGKL